MVNADINAVSNRENVRLAEQLTALQRQVREKAAKLELLAKRYKRVRVYARARMCVCVCVCVCVLFVQLVWIGVIANFRVGAGIWMNRST